MGWLLLLWVFLLTPGIALILGGKETWLGVLFIVVDVAIFPIIWILNTISANKRNNELLRFEKGKAHKMANEEEGNMNWKSHFRDYFSNLSSEVAYEKDKTQKEKENWKKEEEKRKREQEQADLERRSLEKRIPKIKSAVIAICKDFAGGTNSSFKRETVFGEQFERPGDESALHGRERAAPIHWTSDYDSWVIRFSSIYVQIEVKIYPSAGIEVISKKQNSEKFQKSIAYKNYSDSLFSDTLKKSFETALKR